MSAQPRWEPPAPGTTDRAAGLEPVAATSASTSHARLLVALALAGLAAASIHAAAAVTDADEGTATLAFFAGVALAQAVWGLVALARGPRAWLVLGAVANLAVAGVWLWSRTTGLPVGASAGVALPVGFPDAVATALEVALAAGAATLAFRAGRTDRAAARAPGFAVLATVVIGALATVAVLAELGTIGALGAGS